MSDLKLIAMDGSRGEIVKAGLQERDSTKQDIDYLIQLLKLVLVAAINSPKAMDYIGRMPSLSISAQASLKDLIEEVLQDAGTDVYGEAGNKKLQDISDPVSGNETEVDQVGSFSPSPAVDSELLFEQRFGKVMAENGILTQEKKDLQRDLRDLHNRLARLQENNVSLLEVLVYSLGS